MPIRCGTNSQTQILHAGLQVVMHTPKCRNAQTHGRKTSAPNATLAGPIHQSGCCAEQCALNIHILCFVLYGNGSWLCFEQRMAPVAFAMCVCNFRSRTMLCYVCVRRDVPTCDSIHDVRTIVYIRCRMYDSDATRRCWLGG